LVDDIDTVEARCRNRFDRTEFRFRRRPASMTQPRVISKGANAFTSEVNRYGLSGRSTAPVAGCNASHNDPHEPQIVSRSTTSGTSTQVGTKSNSVRSSGAGQRRFPQMSMSSTKSSTGHLLGAAGAVECIFSILAIRDNIAPPTINLDIHRGDGDRFVPQTPQGEINVALSNSFGFGGTNASVIVQRVAKRRAHMQ